MTVPSDGQSWDDVETLLNAALERDEGSRETFVRGATQDRAVAEEVLSLLNCVDSSSLFLEAPSQTAADDPVLCVGERLGAWEVESLIGRGGMGEVYLVRRADGFYEQSAALKLMNSLSVEHEALFDSERQFLARLEHPGIARLLDGGVRSDGRPWMVMEFASGAPIDTWVRDKALGPRAVVSLISSVCDALAHAHSKLIVHRDLKPSNILVDESGRPRVIDFGVARLTSGDDDLSVPLSLDYAAPELLAGEAAATTTDVYGLAATLYALLAHRPPLLLSRDPLPVAVRRAWDEVPTPVSAELSAGRDGALIKDLDAILARALSKQARDRYPTIEAFRDDLERALGGRAVSSRLSERGYVAGRFVKRHRWQTAAAAAVVFSLAAGLSVSLWQARQAWAERESALREQARLEAVQQYLYFMLRDGADASGGTSASAREILEVAGQQV
ncbi:MAG: serine/threonine protein kinase, partial [Brevundimonas sp.]